METESIFNGSDDENERENPYMSDENEPGNREDEAEEVPAPGDQERKVIKPKRVIKNPQPKLDAQRLMGPRGIGILQSSMKDLKFKGKGYEKEDLNMLMKKLEHWAHRLFPKLPFDETLKQIEKLGAKKPVQNMMKRVRLDMFQSDELMESSTQTPETEPKAPEVDIFDELLGTGPFASTADRQEEAETHEIALPIPTQTSKTSIITEEQRERMEKNRRLALERRKARLLELQQKENNLNETNTENAMTSEADFPRDSPSVVEGCASSNSFPTLVSENEVSRAVKPSTDVEEESKVGSEASDLVCSVSQGKDAIESQISDSEAKRRESPVRESTDEDTAMQTESSGHSKPNSETGAWEDVVTESQRSNTEAERGKSPVVEVRDNDTAMQTEEHSSEHSKPNSDVFTEDDILGFIDEEV